MSNVYNCGKATSWLIGLLKILLVGQADLLGAMHENVKALAQASEMIKALKLTKLAIKSYLCTSSSLFLELI